ncbi:hypothetical protein GOODEAATRI_004582 [Goodea atripinnis]|uniref:Uncharacterized protein n=1 Tax=Goodea atripinnis TaxID=208336 RepID=A0ABV0NHH4_9TELE
MSLELMCIIHRSRAVQCLLSSVRSGEMSCLEEYLLMPLPFCWSEVSLSHSNMSESAKPHHPNPQGKGEKSHGGDFSYVGIDAILEQMRRKAMKKGFELNLMVVGKLWT